MVYGKELDILWGRLRAEIGVSEETLQVVTSINGYNEETLLDIPYAVTGYRNFEQVDDAEEEEEEEEDNE